MTLQISKFEIVNILRAKHEREGGRENERVES
jgi:hypothetical protein